MRALSSREALVSFIFFGAEIDLIYTDVFFSRSFDAYKWTFHF